MTSSVSPHSYFPFSSVRALEVCVLNDLFTAPAARGQGIGAALLQHARTYARTRGFAHLRWTTEEANHVAQRLYERTGAEQTSWLHYVLPTTAEGGGLGWRS